MPNGHRGSSGSSPLHSSDSEDRTILKIRKKTLRRRVWRRWRHFARRKALRAADIGDVHVAAPASTMANQVSGKRKSCGDQHPAASDPLSTRRRQGSIHVGGGQPYSLASLDDCDARTLQIVMMYCASSPSAQMNQIGVSNRRYNIAWRRMHRGVLREWIENMQCHLGPHILISDLEDILCLK